MTRPVYKIETYTGLTLNETIINDALSLRIKKNFSIPGNFSFALAGKKADNPVYQNINLFDTVKIYLGEYTVPVTPTFVGKVENIVSELQEKKLTRIISGRDLAEVLTRRMWLEKSSYGVCEADSGHASNVVEKWADDVALGKDVTSDTTVTHLQSFQSKYDEMLKNISDYSTIAKDWYVAEDGDLTWKSRPLRTSGVSVLTIGKNVLDYILTKGLQNEVFNQLYLFGNSEPATPKTSICADTEFNISTSDYPDNHSAFQTAITDWTHGSGSGTETLVVDTVAAHSLNPKSCIKVDNATPLINDYLWAKREFTEQYVAIKNSGVLNYALQPIYNALGGAYIASIYIILEAPDSSNYFRWIPSVVPPAILGYGVWAHTSIQLGPNYEIMGATTDCWRRFGDPDWLNLHAFKIQINWATAAGDDVRMYLDCMYLGALSFFAIGGYYPGHGLSDDFTGSDFKTSHNAYGRRDMMITDNTIHTIYDTQVYRDFIKARYLTPPQQLEVTLRDLDTNILLGDRIPITIADESISAVNFDVIRVEHSISGEKKSVAVTKAMLVNSGTIRDPIKSTDNYTVMRELKTDSLHLATGKHFAR